MIERIRAISHSLRTRLFAAVLLLPLVAFATATSGAMVRCRITGEVMSASCCEGGNGAAKSSPVATASEADCCERVVRNVTTAPAELSATPRALPDETMPVVHVAYLVPPIALLPSALSSRSEARASIGPPTVRLRLVSKSSFLI